MNSKPNHETTSAAPSTGDGQVFIDPATEGGETAPRKAMTLVQELDMLGVDLPEVAKLLRYLSRHVA